MSKRVYQSHAMSMEPSRVTVGGSVNHSHVLDEFERETQAMRGGFEDAPPLPVAAPPRDGALVLKNTSGASGFQLRLARQSSSTPGKVVSAHAVLRSLRCLGNSCVELGMLPGAITDMPADEDVLGGVKGFGLCAYVTATQFTLSLPSAMDAKTLPLTSALATWNTSWTFGGLTPNQIAFVLAAVACVNYRFSGRADFSETLMHVRSVDACPVAQAACRAYLLRCTQTVAAADDGEESPPPTPKKTSKKTKHVDDDVWQFDEEPAQKNQAPRKRMRGPQCDLTVEYAEPHKIVLGSRLANKVRGMACDPTLPLGKPVQVGVGVWMAVIERA